MSVNHTTYEQIINKVVSILENEPEWNTRKAEKTIDKVITSRLPFETLSTTEKAYGIMVLYKNYGLNPDSLTEPVEPSSQSFDKCVSVMYEDAIYTALMHEAKDRLVGTDQELLQKPYRTDVPLATELANMPDPENIVLFLISKMKRKSDHEDNLVTSEYDGASEISEQLLHEYRDAIQKCLSPAQKTYLISQAIESFTDAETEAEPAQHAYTWEEVINNVYLFHSLQNIIISEFEHTEMLPAKTEQYIEQQLTTLRERNIFTAARTN